MLFPYQREELHWAHMQLVKNGLVAWTSGNCSMRLPGTNMIAIKPSGVLYEDLTPSHYIIMGIDSETVEGELKPSTDTASHLYVYRHAPAFNAIVHTHSPAATAWSTLGRGIPCFLTEIADVFGTEIPCAKFSEIGTEALGMAANSAMVTNNCLGATLLQNHGVLTCGASLKEAVRNAVLVEHAASILIKLNDRKFLKLTKKQAQECFERYSANYGQSPPKAAM